MPFLMTDMAAGSTAARTMQQNMYGAQYDEANAAAAAQENQIKVKQAEATLQKTKLGNIVSENDIKTDDDSKLKIAALERTPEFQAALKENDTGKILTMMGTAKSLAGKVEDGAKLFTQAEGIDFKKAQTEAKQLDNIRAHISDAAAVLESIPEAQVAEAFKKLPQDIQKDVISKVGPENWAAMTGEQQKKVVHELYLNANGKIREAQIAQQALLAEKRQQLELEKLRERNAHAERMRGMTQDSNTKMWGTVTSALDRMARDPDYIKKMERLDNEVSDAELAAKQEPTGWFPAAPYKAKDASGVEQNFLDKKSYLKWEQAKKRRDTEYSKHLDEEEALVKTLPASAGTLRDSQLEMIAKQRAGLMLDTPPPKKEVPPPSKDKPSEDALPLLADPKQAGKEPMSTTNLKKYADQYFKGDTKAAIEYLKKEGWVEKPAAGKDVPSNKTGAPKFVEGKVYTDAKGNKAKYVSGKWEPQ